VGPLRVWAEFVPFLCSFNILSLSLSLSSSRSPPRRRSAGAVQPRRARSISPLPAPSGPRFLLCARRPHTFPAPGISLRGCRHGGSERGGARVQPLHIQGPAPRGLLSPFPRSSLSPWIIPSLVCWVCVSSARNPFARVLGLRFFGAFLFCE
jgi:hypothetical protein